MSRLTLRLPETLHQKLARVAEEEGISLNQYIVYALTRQTSSNPTLQASISGILVAHSSQDIEQQKTSLQAFKDSLPKAEPGEIDAILARRELVDCEPELTSDMIDRLREKIVANKLVT